MDYQKKQDQRPEQGHASAIPTALLRRCHNVISHRAPRCPVLLPQQQTLCDMKQKAEYQYNLQRPDNRVGRHKMGPVREGDAAVIDKDHGINSAMHD
jgi:hypothetical protein